MCHDLIYVRKAEKGAVWQPCQHMKRVWEQKKSENRNNYSNPCESLLLLTFYYCRYFHLTQIFSSHKQLYHLPRGSKFCLLTTISYFQSYTNTFYFCARDFFFSQDIYSLWITSDALWNTLKNASSQEAFCMFKEIRLSILNMSFSLLHIVYK